MSYMPWAVSRSYYEVCNCEAICPCRRHGARKGGRSTYGTCNLALSWRVLEGHAGNVDLSVVLAGSYSEDEPGAPWRVILYVDERGGPEQQQALADIFLGRAVGRHYATSHMRLERCTQYVKRRLSCTSA